MKKYQSNTEINEEPSEIDNNQIVRTSLEKRASNVGIKTELLENNFSLEHLEASQFIADKYNKSTVEAYQEIKDLDRGEIFIYVYRLAINNDQNTTTVLSQDELKKIKKISYKNEIGQKLFSEITKLAEVKRTHFFYKQSFLIFPN